MSNPFYYLAGLLMATSYPRGFEPLWSAKRNLAPWAVLGSLLLYAALSWAVLARPPARPPLARFVLRIVALVLYWELIHIFHLPLWIWQLGVEDDPLISTLLILLPLILLYGVLALIHARTDPHSGGIRLAFRGFLGMSFLPILLLLGLEEAFERLEPLRRMAFVYPASGWGVALIGLGLLMSVLPPLLRVILAARPLERGPLRDRLEQMCAVAGFRPTELLVVPTGRSRMANAFVVGLSARWRYVFFTDAILEGMTSDELECVLLHEVTHSQKRHIPFYMVCALSFSLISALGGETLDLALSPALMVSLTLTWMILYWGIAFGYVSRRFETEADLVAARLAPALPDGRPPYGAARRMAAALERVAQLNHVPPWAWSWRHFTIEKRVDILLRAELDAVTGEGWELQCGRFRKGAAALMMAGLLSGGILVGLQVGHAEEHRTLLAAHDAADRGYRLLQEKRYEAARDELRRGVDGGYDSAWVWAWLADAERGLGREEAAREAESNARKKDDKDPRLRLRLGDR
jgi:Zn-dependent protease with chaperone function